MGDRVQGMRGSGSHDLSKRIALARKTALYNSSSRRHRTDDIWVDDGFDEDELNEEGGSYKERCYNYRALINKHEETIKALTEDLKEAKYDVNLLNQKLEKEKEARKGGDTETNRMINGMKDLVNKTESVNINRDNHLVSECDKLIKSFATVENSIKSQNENYKIGGKAFLGIILKFKFEIEHMKEVVRSATHHNSREVKQADSSYLHNGKGGDSAHAVDTTSITPYRHIDYEDPHSNHNTFLDICTALESENAALNSKIEELNKQIDEFEQKEANFGKLISNYRSIIVNLKDEMSANISKNEKIVKELKNNVHSFSVDNSMLLKKVLAYEDSNSSDSIIRKKVSGLEHECLDIDKEIGLLQEEIEMNAKLLTKDYFINIVQSF